MVLMTALTACQPELEPRPLEPAEGLASSRAVATGSCSVPVPGTYAGVDVSISPYVTGGPAGGFQSTPGNETQYPITVTFSRDVESVTVAALDPDYVGNVMIAYDSLNRELGRIAFDGDNTPGSWTRSIRTLTTPGIRSVRLITAPNDYTSWDSLSFVPTPTPCAAPSPGTFCGVDVSITPYVTGGPVGGFQSIPGNGVQSAITVTFSKAVSWVELTAVDPDYANNHMAAYDSSSQELARVYFTGDNTPGVTTRSRKSVSGQGITRVVLTPDPLDYITYESLSFMESCTPPVLQAE
jgi:hypothetical protein